MLSIEERAFSECVALNNIEKEIKKLGTLPPFPQDGMERYDSLQERISSLREKSLKLKHRIDSEKELAAKIKKDQLFQLTDHSEEIFKVERALASIEEHEARLRFLENDISKKEMDLLNDIRQIAPHWAKPAEGAEENLKKAVTVPIALRDIEKLRTDLHAAEAEVRDLDMDVKNEKQKRQSLEGELATLKRGQMGITAVSTEEMQRDVIGIREGYLRSEEISNEIKVLTFALKEFSKERVNFDNFDESDNFGKFDNSSQRLFSMLLLNLVFAGIFTFIAFLFGGGFFTVPVALAFIGISYFFYTKTIAEKNMENDEIYVGGKKDSNFFDSIEKKIAKLKSQRDGVEKEVALCAKRLEISPIGVGGSIEAMAEQLEAVRLKLGYHTDADLQERRLVMRVDDARTRYNAYENSKKGAISRIESMLQAWTEWLDKMNFPANIRPENFDVFILSVNAAKDKLEILTSVRKEAQSEKDFINSIQMSARNLCLKLRIEPENIGIVFKSIKDAPMLKARLNEINDNILRISSESKACDEMIAEYIAEIQKLFAEAGVNSEKEFRRLSDAEEQKWTLEANRAERFENLSGLLNGRKAAEKYISEFLQNNA